MLITFALFSRGWFKEVNDASGKSIGDQIKEEIQTIRNRSEQIKMKNAEIKRQNDEITKLNEEIKRQNDEIQKKAARCPVGKMRKY